MKRNKSYYENVNCERNWVLIDAKDQVLGRLATTISDIVRGKNKPTYTPSINMGDFVVVINSDSVAVTGSKESDKIYYRHSGFPGGLTETSFG